MWNTRLISDQALGRGDGGFEIDIRLPCFRSLPLSVLRSITLTLDGEPIAQDRIALKLNGDTLGLDGFEEREDWWDMLDSGTLAVDHPPLEPGSRHVVDVTLAFELPYVAGAIVPTRCIKTLTAA